ncbi:MAG: hypothetical protein COV76_05935 [Candidatus Omnitrophica bacterium CG11_big_fil_rev_8_21_14_0_20_64_10]|nr:MAG: hypothetical protein COV76_05935 [Candidatus Omnitrophica bacterium CG11_big_fil_rev_8_21_14_0_20_64_10]
MGKRRIALRFVVGAVFVCMVRPEPAGAGRAQQMGTAQYVENVLTAEAEFALRSSANKNLKGMPRGKYRCMEGHWRMMNDKAVFLCD